MSFLSNNTMDRNTAQRRVTRNLFLPHKRFFSSCSARRLSFVIVRDVFAWNLAGLDGPRATSSLEASTKFLGDLVTRSMSFVRTLDTARCQPSLLNSLLASLWPLRSIFKEKHVLGGKRAIFQIFGNILLRCRLLFFFRHYTQANKAIPWPIWTKFGTNPSSCVCQ